MRQPKILITLTLAIIALIVSYYAGTSQSNIDDTISNYNKQQEDNLNNISMKVKRYIDLNAQLVDEPSLNNLIEIKKYLDEDFFNQQYVHTVAFVEMPKEAVHPEIRFKEDVIQKTSYGYKFMAIVNYVFPDGDTFIHTAVVKLNEDGLINNVRLISHLNVGTN